MGNKVAIRPGAFFFAALMILLVPVRWWLGAVLAALVHEAAHVAALLLLGGQVSNISIGALGARIDAMPLVRWAEAAAILAGPLGSFSTLLLTRWFPEMALCGLVQGVYNLLPVYPLDGGRFLDLYCGTGVRIILELTVISALVLLGIWAYFHTELGFAGFFPPLALVSAWFQGKFPCKEANLAVQ